MTTKLAIYNGALALLSETPLSSLSENRSSRQWLDFAWDNDNLIDYCLQQGQWYFATRTMKMTPSTTLVPAFGWAYAYEIPSDFKGMVGLWIDSFCNVGLQDYAIEAGVIYSAWDVIYLKYVSNAPTYGGNLAAWPQAFARFVQAELALLAEPSISNSPTIYQKVEIAQKKRRAIALNNDMRDKPMDTLPLGRWTKSRIGFGLNNFGSGFYGNGVNGF